jgi:hypothetical protein
MLLLTVTEYLHSAFVLNALDRFLVVSLVVIDQNTHLEISRPNPLSLTELCRLKSFSPSFFNRDSTQLPIGFLTASGLKNGRLHFAR